MQNASPVVDAGTANFSDGGRPVLNLANSDYEGNAPDMGAFEVGGGHAGGGVTPAPLPQQEDDNDAAGEIHVQDQVIGRESIFRRYVRLRDIVAIFDGNSNPVSGATVTVEYSGFGSGELRAVTNGSGIAVLETGWLRARGNESACFSVTGVNKEGTEYNSDANTVTTVCE